MTRKSYNNEVFTLEHTLALLCGYLLDALLGDPRWLPHPVRLIGWTISRLETVLRRLFTPTRRGELWAGTVLAAGLPLVCFCLPLALLRAAAWLHPIAAFLLESWMCYQILAVKSLRTESTRVWERLQAGDLAGARQAVSMIVGRDVQRLDEAGVTKAAVETVAENAGDGVIAPLFFLALGGAPLGFCYKAVSTLDSMVGYRNERYQFFGRASARLDDAANWLPARLCGLLMVVAAPLCGFSAGMAWRIYLRDRKKHASPNSAHPEAACAGALGIALAGDAYYGGVLHQKPVLGDDLRPVQPDDIRRANRLMTASSLLMLPLALAVRAFLG